MAVISFDGKLDVESRGVSGRGERGRVMGGDEWRGGELEFEEVCEEGSEMYDEERGIEGLTLKEEEGRATEWEI